MGGLHAALQALVGAPGAFDLQQKSEPIFEGELGILRIVLLGFERRAAPGQT
jgi:hypothetical protein